MRNGYRALTPTGPNEANCNWQKMLLPHGWAMQTHAWDVRNSAAADGPMWGSGEPTIPMQGYRIPRRGELLVPGRERGVQPTHEEWVQVRGNTRAKGTTKVSPSVPAWVAGFQKKIRVDWDKRGGAATPAPWAMAAAAKTAPGQPGPDGVVRESEEDWASVEWWTEEGIPPAGRSPLEVIILPGPPEGNTATVEEDDAVMSGVPKRELTAEEYAAGEKMVDDYLRETTIPPPLPDPQAGVESPIPTESGEAKRRREEEEEARTIALKEIR